MRLFIGAALAASSCLCTMSSSVAAPVDASATDRSFIGFADQFDRAQLAKDRVALERMVSDDLVFIDGSGKRRGKRLS